MHVAHMHTTSVRASNWNTKAMLAGCMQVNQDIQTIASGKYVDDRPEGARSPSPPPIYNENGIRVNSRDQRAKEKLQKQRYVSP